MNIDKIYDLAYKMQIKHNDLECGEILDAEVKGSSLIVSYDNATKKYTMSELQYKEVMH